MAFLFYSLHLSLGLQKVRLCVLFIKYNMTYVYLQYVKCLSFIFRFVALV